MMSEAKQSGAPYHITIAGAGLNGLTLAFALKHALGGRIAITLADPLLDRDPSKDKRAFAVTPSSRSMYKSLGLWDDVLLQAQPVVDMIITDSRVNDPVRPVLLAFAEGNLHGEPLAYMVENAALTSVVMAECRKLDIDFVAAPIERFSASVAGIELEIAGRDPMMSSLLVAADGKRSRLRDLAGIGWVSWPYGQSGIVGTIGHELDHEGIAYEHFLPSGPFAILPLSSLGAPGYRSSIVWTEVTASADYFLQLDDKQQLAEVERRFGPTLGKLSLETRLQSFPLSFGIARRFYADRLALLGDAAHAIHPIAGQGLNLGLEDVAALAEIIVDAVRIGLDPGAHNHLELYENNRRFDVTAKGLSMDGLNRLFSNDSTTIRLLRDFGLGVVNRLPELKRFFVNQAVGGLNNDAPRLLRGEAL